MIQLGLYISVDPFCWPHSMWEVLTEQAIRKHGEHEEEATTELKKLKSF